MAAVRAKAFPHLSFRKDHLAPDEAVNRYFDAIVPDRLPLMPGVLAAMFYSGAEPTWNDIRDGRDAVREINRNVLEAICPSAQDFRCVAFHGPAGCGKTTTIMRVAYELAGQGHAVYFAKGEERADFLTLLEIASELRGQDRRMHVFVDAFSRQLDAISLARDRLSACPNLTLVLTERSNAYHSKCQAIAFLSPIEVEMPHLTDADIRGILDRLEANNYLGVLKNKSRAAQVAAFAEVAGKQLLVAMKEATSGQGFDVILRSEYAQLPRAAQLAYVICCLASLHNAPGVYRRHLLPCLRENTATKVALLEQYLRGVLVSANLTGTMLKPRHRLIGYWVAKEIADEEIKLEALRVFLATISAEIVPNEIRRRSPAYLAYRGMINCDGLWDVFAGQDKLICGVYEDLKSYYSHDFLFWLQYGMARMKANQLDIAENYINQSLAIRDNYQARHQQAILLLRQAAEAGFPAAGLDRANEAIAELKAQILERGGEDSYAYGAFLTYVGRWYDKAGELISQAAWEELRQIAQEALRHYPRDEIIAAADRESQRLYLMRAVRRC